VGARPSRNGDPASDTRDVSFEVFYQDDEIALVRGEFYNFARWVVFREARGGGLGESRSVRKQVPVVVAVPNRPECKTALAEGKATARFRPSEGNPFQLTSGSEVCPILGFARVFQAPTPVGTGRQSK
jgi:hypothetical protein